MFLHVVPGIDCCISIIILELKILGDYITIFSDIFLIWTVFESIKLMIPLHTKINFVVSDPGLIAEKDFMKKCTSKLKIY